MTTAEANDRRLSSSTDIGNCEVINKLMNEFSFCSRVFYSNKSSFLPKKLPIANIFLLIDKLFQIIDSCVFYRHV